VIKATAVALAKYPEFNSSLEGSELVVKHYFHIGVAVDTPNGLAPRPPAFWRTCPDSWQILGG